MNSVIKLPRTVILAGAGHAHLHVVAQAHALLAQGARVVLVDPTNFWYSGLATGMLAGRYEPAEDQLDPKTLAEAHGVEFIRDRIESVDPATRRIHLAGGTALTYDYLSISVGSQVTTDAIASAANDASVWPVKPIRNLWKLREHLEADFRSGKAPRVAVVGGGPTGCEVTANVKALAARHGIDLPVTLIMHGDRLIARAPAGAARSLQEKLMRRGITILPHTRINRRDGTSLIAEDGKRIPADLVVLATGLEAHPLIYTMGLPTHAGRGLRINDKLHSIADKRIFASGDCAAMEGFDLPKLGVFGVRQAICLHANLLASLEGNPLSDYVPQKRYLAILNLGDGTALAIWGPFWSMGRFSMWLKDRIDRRFLNSYREHRTTPLRTPVPAHTTGMETKEINP